VEYYVTLVASYTLRIEAESADEAKEKALEESKTLTPEWEVSDQSEDE
jgi:hypothetical protein